MSALLIDADGAGYLESHDVIAVQRLRHDFAVTCRSIALSLLQVHTDTNVAASALANELAQLRTSISQVGFEQDDAILFPFLEDHIRQALERESGKSELARNLSRFILLIPNAFRWASLSVIAGVLIWAIIDFFQRH